MIKNFIRHIPYYYFSIVKQYRLINQNKKFGIGSLLDFNKLKKFKTSETLFIMGSGPSICDLSDSQFNIISQHDSFGFTNWTMHDHVPTYYMNEFKSKNSEMVRCQEQELANLVSKKEQYKNTALIFRAGSTTFEKITGIEKYGFPFEHVFLAMDIKVVGTNIADFKKSLLILKSIGVLKSKYLMIQKTASLFRTIIFGYKLGYKNIVLCGIDLTGGQYFFEREKDRYMSKNLIFPIITSHRNNKSHKTNDARVSTGGMIISDIVYATNEALLYPKSINNLDEK